MRIYDFILHIHYSFLYDIYIVRVLNVLYYSIVYVYVIYHILKIN